MAHQLHHRREFSDIRNAYDSDRSFDSDRDSERSYQRSQTSSDRSYSTQPTIYSAASSRKPPQIHQSTSTTTSTTRPDSPRPPFVVDRRRPEESPRASVETYASTVPSEEDLIQELPEYEVPQYTARPYESQAAIPATPTDFSELFPSHRRLLIRHDDSTLDGNMNLRVDTEVVMHGGRRRDMTLFHLRMHDLRDREFSLRRYCRDSGREVCHSARKQQKQLEPKRPGFQRSLSNALSSMRSRSDSRTPTLASLTRHDSGYASAHSSIELDDDRPSTHHGAPKPEQPVEPNSMKLEFSNYAQVDIKRTGTKGNKRYDFEYWGTHYAWRKVVRKEHQATEISYHLVKAGHERAVAYIIPSPLTATQADEEQSKGGWVAPCSMWIADGRIVERGQKDVADVIISTGLMALVDDAIKTRFHSQDSKPMMIPKLGVEYVGPKRLINEMFKREGSGQHSRNHSRQSSSSRSRPSSSVGPGPSSATGARVTLKHASGDR